MSGPEEQGARSPVAALFDTVADEYDQTGIDFFEPIAAGLVAELDPQPGESCVDLGCGRGAVTLGLAERVLPEGSVVGLDVSSGMLAHARELLSARGLDVDLRVGDASDPALPPGAADVVAVVARAVLPARPGCRAGPLGRAARSGWSDRARHLRRPGPGLGRGRQGVRAVGAADDEGPEGRRPGQPVLVRRGHGAAADRCRRRRRADRRLPAAGAVRRRRRLAAVLAVHRPAGRLGAGSRPTRCRASWPGPVRTSRAPATRTAASWCGRTSATPWESLASVGPSRVGAWQRCCTCRVRSWSGRRTCVPRRGWSAAGSPSSGPPRRTATSRRCAASCCPGLVDAHCHVGLDAHGAVDDATAEAQALADREAGHPADPRRRVARRHPVDRRARRPAQGDPGRPPHRPHPPLHPQLRPRDRARPAGRAGAARGPRAATAGSSWWATGSTATPAT